MGQTMTTTKVLGHIFGLYHVIRKVPLTKLKPATTSEGALAAMFTARCYTQSAVMPW